MEARAVANGSHITTLPDKVRKHLQQRLGLQRTDENGIGKRKTGSLLASHSAIAATNRELVWSRIGAGKRNPHLIYPFACTHHDDLFGQRRRHQKELVRNASFSASVTT